MTTSEIRMGERTLGRAAALVAAARQDLDGLCRTLEAQVAGLHGGWSGAGGQAFFRLHAAWTERQRSIVAALDGFEASLLGTERLVRGTDEAQAAGYSRTLGRLG